MTKSPRPGLLWSSTLAAVVGVASVCNAADVKGAVEVRGELPMAEPGGARAPYVKEWNGFVPPNKPRVDIPREVTLVLIGPASSTGTTEAAISGGQLSPTTIVVQQGAPLRIRNGDDCDHQLYASELPAFDAVVTSPGQERLLQIDEAGTYSIRDRRFPHVQGTLIVLPALTSALVPSDSGKFVLESLPAGSYELKVFVRGQEMASQAFEVGSRDIALSDLVVDLSKRK